jgi:hypothetical protein
LKLRDIVFTSAGAVRAGWRALLFCVLMVALYIAAIRLTFFLPRPRVYAVFEVEQYVAILIAIWLAHYIMLRWVDHASWSYVGLGRGQLSPGVLVLGLCIGALGILIPSGTLLLAHDLTVTTGLHGSHSWLGLALAGAVIFLPQALGEEMMTRGYLFAALRDGVGWLGALVATSVGFGLLHLGNPGANAQSVAVVIFAGVFLAAVLVATGSLYAAWMAHFAWNWSMAELLHAAVSGVRFPYSTYRMDGVGPAWLTGGAWGPEGGVAAVAGMLAGIAVLVAWRRRASPTSSSA